MSEPAHIVAKYVFKREKLFNRIQVKKVELMNAEKAFRDFEIERLKDLGLYKGVRFMGTGISSDKVCELEVSEFSLSHGDYITALCYKVRKDGTVRIDGPRAQYGQWLDCRDILKQLDH